MGSKLGEGSSGVGDHQRSPEKDGRSRFEYGTSCAVVWFSQRSQARVQRARDSEYSEMHRKMRQRTGAKG